MGFSDVPASRKQLSDFRERMAKLKEQNDRERMREAERVTRSGQATVRTGTLKTPAVTVWDYEVLDDREVRITGCATQTWELEIPDRIEGLPVTQVGEDACARLESVVRIVCPPTIVHIAPGAFRLNPDLVGIDLPAEMDRFDRQWLSGCTALADILMPGKMERFEAGLFEEFALAKLRLGPCVREIEPASFACTALADIEVDPANPYITTDGRSLFSDDGETLVVLATPLESYEVPEGCRRIAVKAFLNRSELEMISLPNTLEEIGDSAFAQSGLRSLIAPPSLRRIGDRAFFRCMGLKFVSLNEGVEWIGDMAFAATGLSVLHIPSTAEHLGEDFAANTEISFTGSGASFSVERESDHEVDLHGGLYHNMPDGKHLVRFMDHTATRYEVAPGTRFVDSRVFIRHAALEEVVLPEGLEGVGASAFSGCHRLTRVNLPSTLRSLGTDAFYDTMVDHLVLPAGLTDIGDGALATRGSINDGIEPSIHDLRVDPANPKFRVAGPLLIEHLSREEARRRHVRTEGDMVVLYLGGEERVHIPESVVAVAPYAFSGARDLRELRFSNRIEYIDKSAFDIDCIVERLQIDLKEPIEGHDSFDLRFPRTMRSRHEVVLALGRSERVDIASILRHYDDAIINMTDIGGTYVDASFGRYWQAKGMMARLKDPVLMSTLNQGLMDRTIRGNLPEICMAFARHDDREAMSDLADLGYLDEANLLAIIDLVGRLGDAAMTGYLLEMRRSRFGTSGIDLSL